MSTVEATISTQAIESSYNDSHDRSYDKISDSDENIIDYLKVKTEALERCNNKLEQITKIITDQYSQTVFISLVDNGNYKGYYKIIADHPNIIETTKTLLLKEEKYKETGEDFVDADSTPVYRSLSILSQPVASSMDTGLVGGKKL